MAIAYYLDGTGFQGRFSTWTAAGAFNLSCRKLFASNQGIILGQFNSFDNYIAAVSGEVVVKLAGLSAVNTGVTVAAGSDIEVVISRDSSDLTTISVNGTQTNQLTQAGTVSLTSVFYNPSGSLSSGTGRFYGAILSTSGDDRDYQVTSNNVIDVNGSGFDLLFVSAASTYSFVAYDDGTGSPITVNAGVDQANIQAGATVNLSGTAVTSGASSITSTVWTQLIGTSVTIVNPNTLNPSFLAPSDTSPSTLEFRLTASDGTESATDDVSISVLATGATNPNELNFNDGIIPPTIFGVRTDYEVDNGRLTKLANGNFSPLIFDVGTARGDVSAVLNVGGLNTGAFGVIVRGAADGSHILVAVTPQSSTSAQSRIYTYTVAGGYITLESGPFIPNYSSTTDVDIDITLSDGVVSATFNNGGAVSANTTFNENESGIGLSTAVSNTELDLISFTSVLTANAGIDLTSIEAGANTQLNGINSIAGPSPITSYLWEQTSGDNVTINNSTSAVADFDAPTTNAPQTLEFRLTIGDGSSTSQDSVQIGVLAENVAPPPTYNIVWEGDSRTIGTGSTPATPIPDRVNALITPTPAFFNIAVGGQQTSDAVTNFTANMANKFNAGATNNLYIINGFGINDISGFGGERSLAQIQASITTLCNNAAALGYDVLLTTVPPRDTTPANREQIRVDLNTWIMTNPLASISFVYDLNQDSRIGVWSTTYYDDVSHLNFAGQNIWATNISNAIETYYSQPTNTRPVATISGATSANYQASVNLSGGVIDPDTGDTHSYTWIKVSGAGVMPSDLTTQNIVVTGGTHSGSNDTVIELTVNDGTENSLPVQHTIAFAQSGNNTAPTAIITGSTSAANRGSVALQGSVNDPDTGDTHTYTWRVISGSGTLSATNTQNVTVSGPSIDTAQSTVLGLIVNDGTVNSAEATHTIAFAAAVVTPPTSNPTITLSNMPNDSYEAFIRSLTSGQVYKANQVTVENNTATSELEEPVSTIWIDR